MADQKLDLKRTLFALDKKDKKFYNKLLDEEKKEYKPYVLMRFMSSCAEQANLHEYHVQMTNDIVNDNFWSLNKHPELQHLLLCIVGTGRKNYHPWIKGPSKQKLDSVKKVLGNKYKGLNRLEFEIITKNTSMEDFENFCKDAGFDEKETKAFVQQFKKLKDEK